MNVGFLGTGEIASALVKGLAGQGHTILVSERNAHSAAMLAEAFSEVKVATNSEVVAEAQVIFVCLMANVAREVMSTLPWRSDQIVISVMVDMPLANLGLLCAPATQIYLTIPLGPVATGGSVLPVHPDCPALRGLFGGANQIIPVASEAGLNAHFAATALSAPLLSQMQAGAGWLAKQTGDKAGAEAFVAGVFAGFLHQMAQEGSDFETLLVGLSTEGGLNATLRARMENAGTLSELTDGMESLKPRLGL